jgi:DNA-binding transcriptional MerR regulator
MAALTIQDVSRRSGLREPTLRYYEDIGLIGPVARDASSGHRRYRDGDLDTLQALACLRAMGVGIEDMRTYQANRERGQAAAADQRDPLLRHAERIEAEVATLRAHLEYPREKAALWDTRDRGDVAAEAEANQRVQDMAPRLREVPRCALFSSPAGLDMSARNWSQRCCGPGVRCVRRCARLPAGRSYEKPSVVVTRTTPLWRSSSPS